MPAVTRRTMPRSQKKLLPRPNAAAASDECPASSSIPRSDRAALMIFLGLAGPLPLDLCKAYPEHRTANNMDAIGS
jgi:hypothetical protein